MDWVIEGERVGLYGEEIQESGVACPTDGGREGVTLAITIEDTQGARGGLLEVVERTACKLDMDDDTDEGKASNKALSAGDSIVNQR